MFEGAWPFTIETPLATYVLEFQCHKAEVEVDVCRCCGWRNTIYYISTFLQYFLKTIPVKVYLPSSASTVLQYDADILRGSNTLCKYSELSSTTSTLRNIRHRQRNGQDSFRRARPPHPDSDSPSHAHGNLRHTAIAPRADRLMLPCDRQIIA